MAELNVKTNSGFIKVISDKPYFPEGKCRGCGKIIYWGKTINGKNMPVSILGDGSAVSHFYDCPQANNFRKKDVATTKNE